MSVAGARSFYRPAAGDGKVRFESFAAAEKVQRWRGRKRRGGKKSKKPGMIYRCDHCRSWHIGGSQ